MSYAYKGNSERVQPWGHCCGKILRGRFRLVAITLLHVQVDHSSFVTDKGIPKSNTTIQRGERVLRTCPLALENMALVAEFEVSVPDFRLFFKALQSPEQFGPRCCAPSITVSTHDLVQRTGSWRSRRVSACISSGDEFQRYKSCAFRFRWMVYVRGLFQ